MDKWQFTVQQLNKKLSCKWFFNYFGPSTLRSYYEKLWGEDRMDIYSTVRTVMAEMWVIPNLNSLNLGNNSNEYVGAEGVLGLSSNQSLPGSLELLEALLWAWLQLWTGFQSSLSAALKQEIKPQNEAELEVTHLSFRLLDSTEPNSSHLEGTMYNSRI